MSSGGTRSVIHYDADHNLHCLVAGRKDFIMIEKKYYEDLYFLEKVRCTKSQTENSERAGTEEFLVRAQHRFIPTMTGICLS